MTMNTESDNRFIASSDMPLGTKEDSSSCEDMKEFIMSAEKLGFSASELSELKAAYIAECGEKLK